MCIIKQEKVQTHSWLSTQYSCEQDGYVLIGHYTDQTIKQTNLIQGSLDFGKLKNSNKKLTTNNLYYIFRIKISA